ncbi:MAG: TolC family protein [Haliscomenobacter sp.]|nr:TolC family protein [Haliscomenobacter sp.]
MKKPNKRIPKIWSWPPTPGYSFSSTFSSPSSTSKPLRRKKINADTLYGISKGRFEVGRIAETELLQIELSVANAENAIAQSTLNLQSSMEQLRTFLGIQRAARFEMVPPLELPSFIVDPNQALQFALQNRSLIVSWNAA